MNNIEYTRTKELARILPQDRPREKARVRGIGTLTDLELLALLLGSGTRGDGVLSLAQRILLVVDEKGDGLGLSDLLSIRGIGEAKATMLLAAVEFARRRIRPHHVKIRVPRDILPLVQHYAEKKQEHFICISLNGAHEVIATRVVSLGLVNSTQVHPREVFSDPIVDRACSIVVAHNHPSGDLTPSQQDRQVTKSLRDSGALLGIKVLDHIIFTQAGYYSFQENEGW